MKTGRLILGFILLTGAISAAWAQSTFYYNYTTNPGWFGTTPWGASNGGPYNTTWTSGWIADFETSVSNKTVAISTSTAVGGLINNGPQTVSFSGSGTVLTLGGNVSGNFSQGLDLTLAGNFNYTSGTFNMGGNSGAYSGTATISGGILIISQPVALGTSGNFTANGGTIRFENNTGNAGALTINSGAVTVGRTTSDSTVNMSVSSLSGTGGSLGLRGSASISLANTLTVNQSSNTTYSGTIAGTSNNLRLVLNKQGAGDLTLGGVITGLQRTTTVSGGRLYINNASTSFGDDQAGTAILVSSGGALGGTGTITTLAGDSVVVANGGGLVAGLAGAAGRTTYTLGSGSSLDISGVSSATGWLSFDLGTNATAGTTYDQIKLTSGNFVIGTGLLNFNDFAFNALSGFGGTGGPYVYTLFDTQGITGTLGSSLSGTISGYDATLSQSGNNLLLTVVPEPTTYMLMGIGLAAILFVRKRK